MAVDFWNKNLNSHTMFSNTAYSFSRVVKRESKKGHYTNIENLQDYVSANSLREEFGFTTRGLKKAFNSFGDEPKFSNGITYYPIANLESVKESFKNKHEVVDMSHYISNKELMKMFDYDANKAFYIANKENLVKKRISGNSNYYEKEKAIEVFLKYKKQV